jgi:hypothetical protein
MRTLLMAAALAALQDPAPETGEDLDKHARKSLQAEVAVVKDLTLPMFFYMHAVGGDLDVECYVDPVAVPKIEAVKTSVEFVGSLEEALEKNLKGPGLLHFVWQGILVITDEKGRKAFLEADWTGLSQKQVKERPDLAKKLNRAFTFKWDAYQPREALKEFAAVSGVAIKTDSLGDVKVERERRGMIAPKRTTLWGALVCLARTTGITYEFAKDGSIVARPPKK